MYVNWLLEFVWIIFVQGPLIVIRGLQGFIEKLFSIDLLNSFFSSKNPVDNILLSYSFYFIISVFIGVMVFVGQLVLVFASGSFDLKTKILNLLKRSGKSLLLIVIFPIIFMGFIAFVSAINNTITSIVLGNKGNIKFELADNINKYYGDNLSDKDFGLKTDSVENISTTVNFIIQVSASMTGMIIIIWFFWNFIQKIIEIFILFVSYPIGVGLTLGESGIKRKIWINEILNKSIVIIINIIFYFLFLTILKISNKFITDSVTDKVSSISSLSPILKFVFLFTASTSIISMNWFFSRSIRQHNGFLQSLNSIKQTGLFAKSLYTENTKITSEYKYSKNVSVNSNVNSVRSDLKSVKSLNKDNYNGLKKINIYKR